MWASDMITSTRNPAVKAARRLARRSERDATGSFLVEGARVLEEAVAFLRTLFVAADADERERALATTAERAGTRTVAVSGHVRDALAQTATPQGLVGVASLPAVSSLPAHSRLVLLLDEVADPGNLGAIVRSADAAGADAVLVTSGSVDAQHPRAVRASAGSLFHLPVVQGLAFEQALRLCVERGLRTVAADARASEPYTEVDLSQPSAIVLGSEAHGMAPEQLERCDLVAAVPMRTPDREPYTGEAESLNLAATATLFAFEAARQRALGVEVAT